MFSENKAQAGLEYLITYGWAIVIVATVVGIIALFVSAPTQTIQCNISDPTNFSFKGITFPVSISTTFSGGYDYWYFTPTENSKIILQNLTGGKIKVTGIRQEGYFYYPFSVKNKNCVVLSESNFSEIASGENLEIDKLTILYMHDPAYCTNFSGFCPSGRNYCVDEGKIIVSYKDQFDLDREVEISCMGFPPKS